MKTIFAATVLTAALGLTACTTPAPVYLDTPRWPTPSERAAAAEVERTLASRKLCYGMGGLAANAYQYRLAGGDIHELLEPIATTLADPRLVQVTSAVVEAIYALPPRMTLREAFEVGEYACTEYLLPTAPLASPPVVATAAAGEETATEQLASLEQGRQQLCAHILTAAQATYQARRRGVDRQVVLDNLASEKAFGLAAEPMRELIKVIYEAPPAPFGSPEMAAALPGLAKLTCQRVTQALVANLLVQP